MIRLGKIKSFIAPFMYIKLTGHCKKTKYSGKDKIRTSISDINFGQTFENLSEISETNNTNTQKLPVL